MFFLVCLCLYGYVGYACEPVCSMCSVCVCLRVCVCKWMMTLKDADAVSGTGNGCPRAERSEQTTLYKSQPDVDLEQRRAEGESIGKTQTEAHFFYSQ